MAFQESHRQFTPIFYSSMLSQGLFGSARGQGQLLVGAKNGPKLAGVGQLRCLSNSNSLAKISSQIPQLQLFCKIENSSKKKRSTTKKKSTTALLFLIFRQRASVVAFLWQPKIKGQPASYFTKPNSTSVGAYFLLYKFKNSLHNKNSQAVGVGKHEIFTEVPLNKTLYYNRK